MEYSKALLIAQTLVGRFESACERIEIAGSLRRQRPEVHDIDICLVPRRIQRTDLFGQPNGEISLLDERLGGIGEFKLNGPRHKHVWLPDHEIHVELWIVLPPAQWGVILAIRTGPADFSKWLVMARQHGGAMPSYLKCQDGVIWNGKTPIAAPEEPDFFQLLELPWMEPKNRKPQMWTPKRALA